MNNLVTIVYQPDCDQQFTYDLLSKVNEQLLVIDNSPNYNDLKELRESLKVSWLWNQGYNLVYGLGLNEAFKRLSSDNVIYFSSKRSRILDNGWIEDLVRPLADRRIGMTGCLLSFPYTSIVQDCRFGDYYKYPQVHIQGGVWAARLETMLSNPYSYRFPHVFSDVWISWKLQSVDYTLMDVSSIKSVASGKAVKSSRAKFIHEY